MWLCREDKLNLDLKMLKIQPVVFSTKQQFFGNCLRGTYFLLFEYVGNYIIHPRVCGMAGPSSKYQYKKVTFLLTDIVMF